MARHGDQAEPGFRRFWGRPGRRPVPESGTHEPGLASDGVSVCLAILARNEAGTLPRLAQSVRPHIQQWLVIDTGSTDGTAAVARREFAGIPGEVVERPWVDFGHNRTEMLSLVPSSATHVLILDADMTLECDAPLGTLLGDVPGDRFLVRITEPGLEYRLPLLLRTGVPWRYVGATHEYLDCDEPTMSIKVNFLSIVHHADGRVRGEKLTRDLDLLMEEIQRNPGNARTMFYLGQTLAGLGDWRAAVGWYTRCAEISTWNEEIYVALCSMGELHMVHNEIDEAMVAYTRATELGLGRPEAFYRLAQMANHGGDHEAARMWAEAGLVRKTNSDALFLEPWTRTWGLPYEWAIAAWSTGDAAAARSMFASLADAALPPEPFLSACRTNATRPLPGDEARAPSN